MDEQVSVPQFAPGTRVTSRDDLIGVLRGSWVFNTTQSLHFGGGTAWVEVKMFSGEGEAHERIFYMEVDARVARSLVSDGVVVNKEYPSSGGDRLDLCEPPADLPGTVH